MPSLFRHFFSKHTKINHKITIHNHRIIIFKHKSKTLAVKTNRYNNSLAIVLPLPPVSCAPVALVLLPSFYNSYASACASYFIRTFISSSSTLLRLFRQFHQQGLLRLGQFHHRFITCYSLRSIISSFNLTQQSLCASALTTGDVTMQQAVRHYP